MNLSPRHSRNHPSPRETGMVTVLFIGLLAIMMVLLTVEASSIIRLRQEVRLLERQQVHRLNSSATNAVPAALHHE